MPNVDGPIRLCGKELRLLLCTKTDLNIINSVLTPEKRVENTNKFLLGHSTQLSDVVKLWYGSYDDHYENVYKIM